MRDLGTPHDEDAVKGINRKLPIHLTGQLNRWVKHFTTVLNRITSHEILSIMNDMQRSYHADMDCFSE